MPEPVYAPFFGFRENPFHLTPDPHYLYLSRYHQEALDHLLYGIRERKGFIAITGGIGTGKTTLCRALLDRLDPNIRSALIFSSYLTDLEIVKTITQEFGIPMGAGAKSKKEHIDLLNRFLLDIYGEGGNALLLIDEAQNLSPTVLEQIRMLSNLETEKDKLIQVVLVGQSELKGILASPSLRQLNERITVRYDLKPLEAQDVEGYVTHRIRVAGGEGSVNFTKGAFTAIYGYSCGNPRRINAVCDRALLIAYTEETRTIRRNTIRKAVADLRGDAGTVGGLKQGISPFTVVLILLLLMGMTLAGWRLNWGPVLPPPPRSEAPPGQGPEQGTDGLFLDEASSFAGLFDLFRMEGHHREGKVYTLYGSEPPEGPGLRLEVVSLNLAPEYFKLLKKPFRVLAADPLSPSPADPRYLLIRESNDRGAVAVDREGRPRPLTRDFLLRHWGGRISFLYPHASPDVLRVQQILNRLGYPVAETGVPDEETHREIARFQKDFGLNADGRIGHKTLALLFQMTE